MVVIKDIYSRRDTLIFTRSIFSAHWSPIKVLLLRFSELYSETVDRHQLKRHVIYWSFSLPGSSYSYFEEFRFYTFYYGNRIEYLCAVFIFIGKNEESFVSWIVFIIWYSCGYVYDVIIPEKWTDKQSYFRKCQLVSD